MEFHFVLLRALALCYPEVFHVREGSNELQTLIIRDELQRIVVYRSR